MPTALHYQSGAVLIVRAMRRHRFAALTARFRCSLCQNGVNAQLVTVPGIKSLVDAVDVYGLASSPLERRRRPTLPLASRKRLSHLSVILET